MELKRNLMIQARAKYEQSMHDLSKFITSMQAITLIEGYSPAIVEQRLERYVASKNQVPDLIRAHPHLSLAIMRDKNYAQVESDLNNAGSSSRLGSLLKKIRG